MSGTARRVLQNRGLQVRVLSPLSLKAPHLRGFRHSRASVSTESLELLRVNFRHGRGERAALCEVGLGLEADARQVDTYGRTDRACLGAGSRNNI